MKRYSSYIVLVVCVTALIYGSIELLFLRYESGDVYPEYSSLRSDPLGTMALYESIGKLEGFKSARDFSATGLPDPLGVTYLHIATTEAALDHISPADLLKTEQFVRQGARLVITFFPEAARKPKPVGEKKPMSGAEQPTEKTVSLWEQWGLKPRVINLRRGKQESFEAVPVSNFSGLKLPEMLDWHSGLVFEKLNEAWKPIYLRGKDPVLVERHFGAGSVVIATDSYFLSNEALRDARHSDLLAWMIGPNRKVIFDEAHLGVVEQPGVAALIGRYRLHWVIAALVLLAALFVWKNATSLVPAHSPETATAYIEGKDSASGFVNLLRRNVAAREILTTCYSEWKKTAAQSGRYSALRLQKAEAAFNAENSKPAKTKEPVETYRAITGILHKKDMSGANASPIGRSHQENT